MSRMDKLKAQREHNAQESAASTTTVEDVVDIITADPSPDVNEPVIPEVEAPKKEKPKKAASSKKAATDSKGNTDKGLGKNKDGTWKQSLAGHPEVKRKKPQVMLTLKPETEDRLKDFDESGYKKLLSRFIDKNIDTIISELEKL